jgi:hypothetical protein
MHLAQRSIGSVGGIGSPALDGRLPGGGADPMLIATIVM